MHDYVYDIASTRDGICGIRLYVERTNLIAQQTYDSLGMSRSRVFRLSWRSKSQDSQSLSRLPTYLSYSRRNIVVTSVPQ